MKDIFRKLSLKHKLNAMILLTSVIVLALASLTLILHEASSYWRNGKEKLVTLADVIGENTASAIIFDDQVAAQETLKKLNANPQILRGYIITRDKKLFAEYGRLGVQRTVKNAEIIIREAESRSLREMVSAQKVAVPITKDGRVIGTVVIEADMNELYSRLKWLLCVFGVVALLDMIIAYLIASKLQAFVSEPILLLSSAMRTVSAERNYSIRTEAQIDDEIGVLFDGFNEMLSQIEKRDMQLADLAHFDSLTHLPNRVMFQERLRQAILYASRTDLKIAVMFIDLDEFKDVNDTLGHRVGDLLLKEVSVRLLEHVRQSDTVARLGGDEFVYFFQNVGSIAEVSSLAEKVVENFSRPFFVEGKSLNITASIGISLFPADGETVEELVKNADVAMYQAKKKGKDLFQFFSREMHDKACRRLAMVNSLRRAQENNELLLHYQPKVNMLSGKVTGMEALLRWQHPEYGMVPPDEFIFLAEESGLIIQIGEWVLKSVCLQIREWLDMGCLPLPVSVNVSAYQFWNHKIEMTIAAILSETGVDPACLELELTESAIMENVEEAMVTLTALKSMGIRISIDDFGTGYSSLSYLNRFRVDFLKIDRSFVMNTPNNRDDCAIVTAIIALAHILELKVIAEGVETEEQFAFLKRQGCQEIQGFLCSRPLPPDELLPYLQGRIWRETAPYRVIGLMPQAEHDHQEESSGLCLLADGDPD